MLKKIDKSLAWAVVLLGAAQCASTFYFFRRFEEPAAWFFAGGMLLALVGALSWLRLRYGASAPGVRRVSMAAGAALAVFYVVLYWGLWEKFARRPSSYLGLFIVVAHAAVAMLDGRGRERRRGETSA